MNSGLRKSLSDRLFKLTCNLRFLDHSCLESNLLGEIASIKGWQSTCDKLYEEDARKRRVLENLAIYTRSFEEIRKPNPENIKLNKKTSFGMIIAREKDALNVNSVYCPYCGDHEGWPYTGEKITIINPHADNREELAKKYEIPSMNGYFYRITCGWEKCRKKYTTIDLRESVAIWADKGKWW